ncbi:hypothetical protein F4781DRAFT_48870 [Annulohypoxylon bovei var. microspora]|nr:hypothetical protein F4781DRAFT_48870 [Annulohypoxylon bovei var. microspora]
MNNNYPVAPPYDASPTDSSTPDAAGMGIRGEQILNEVEEEKMAERARLATIKLIRCSATLMLRLRDFMDRMRQSQERTNAFMGHAKHMLQWAEKENPGLFLEQFDELLGRAEQLSASFLSNVDALTSFFQNTDLWAVLFDQFDRLCLPPSFWEIKAMTALQHLTIPSCNFPRIMHEILVTQLKDNEEYAEHFCRLSVDGRVRFITLWLTKTADWEFNTLEYYLVYLFDAVAFDHLPDYDRRPIAMWVDEESLTSREDIIEQASREASRKALQEEPPAATEAGSPSTVKRRWSF